MINILGANMLLTMPGIFYIFFVVCVAACAITIALCRKQGENKIKGHGGRGIRTLMLVGGADGPPQNTVPGDRQE